MSIQLEFVGHACFRIWEDGRPTILTDPYDHETLGLPDDGRRLEAHTVIVSSLTDPAHDNIGMASGNPRVINALDVARGECEAVINGGPLITVAAREHPNHTDHSPQDNALYAFRAGGLWFLHMGDLGYELSAEQLEPLQDRCDVFLVITGARNTPTHDELGRMIDCLKPRWLVPMHYELPPVSFGATPIEDFLATRPRDPVYLARCHTVSFPLPTSDPSRPTIVVLEPSGYRPTKPVAIG